MSASSASAIVGCRTALPDGAPRVRVSATENGQEHSWDLTDPVTLIGWGEPCFLKLEDKSISKVQCLLVNTGNAVLLRDLHSPKPTRLNGEPVSLAELADGNVIAVGKVELTVHIDPAKPARRAGKTSPTKMPGTIVLVDTQSSEQAVLDKAVCLVGRREKLDVPLDDAEVSPAHAAIFHFAGRPMILDLASRKGITVNGQAVACRELRSNDQLHVGPFEVVVQLNGWKDPDVPLSCDNADRSASPKTKTSIDSLLTSTGSEPFEGMDDLRRLIVGMHDDVVRGRDQLIEWEKDLQVLIEHATGSKTAPGLPSIAGHPPAQPPKATTKPAAKPELPAKGAKQASPNANEMLAKKPIADKAPTQPAKAAAKKPSPAPEAAGKTPSQTKPEKSKASAPKSPSRPDARKADQKPAESDQPEGKTVVNSIDLDPDVAQKLRLMRRLSPDTDEGLLLQQILEGEGEQAAKPSKKRSWWSKK